MRINKEQLEALAALPDEKLWAEILKMAKGYGFDLPGDVPDHADLEKLRNMVRGSKINVAEAMKLLNDYRKKNRGSGL